LGEKTVYITPDDLLARQLYDKGIHVPAISLALGLDAPRVIALLCERLGAAPTQVFAEASLHRIRVERHAPAQEAPSRVSGSSFSREDAQAFVVAAAHYLARGVSRDGHYRYSVDAPSDQTNPGYDWPRHAGATFFLAQAAGLTQDPVLRDACSRAASLLRGSGLSSCAGLPCVGDEPVVALGSSALALLALSEVVERGIDDSYRPLVVDLARFIRSQERTDGEFMHEYDRTLGRPIDVQGLYYSSEATLALARAYNITHDPRDLDGAVRGLRNLVGPAWSFFGDRYYFGEEHWTCQAMAVLWDHAPDPQALDFCFRWQEFGRALQQRAGDSYFDADGAIGVGPVVTPRLTPVASRGEAAVATLDVGRRQGFAPAEVAKLDDQLRRSFALLVRQQFRPGPRHLFRDPAHVYGGMPGSEVDWELRIDFAQHAGSAMVRWLETVDVGSRAAR
jgi:hypothetical protein